MSLHQSIVAGKCLELDQVSVTFIFNPGRHTLLGAVLKSSPVTFDISAATLTSKPFFVFNPCKQVHRCTSRFYSTHGTDRGAPLSEKAQTRENVFHPLDAVFDLLDIAAKLLAKSQGSGILGLQSVTRCGCISSLLPGGEYGRS